MYSSVMLQLFQVIYNVVLHVSLRENVINLRQDIIKSNSNYDLNVSERC